MSSQQQTTSSATPIDEQSVVKYLRTHPDFFSDQPHLLAELALPHETGVATSLIERQVSILRHHNHQYRQQLQDLVQIAHDNEQLIQRLQQLTLSLMDTEQLPDMIALLQSSLQTDFHADAAVLYLAGVAHQPTDISNDNFIRLIHHAGAGDIPRELRKILASAKPCCGKFKTELLDSLFTDEGQHIATAALLPLHFDATTKGAQGLLAIGSHDDKRFHAEMGTQYLQFMAELISRKLAPHLVAA